MRHLQARFRLQSGQGSVEYALVLFAFLALLVALGILMEFLRQGSLIEHALDAASYHFAGFGGAVQDVFLF